MACEKKIMVKTLGQMIKDTKGRKEVTITMLRKNIGTRLSEKTLHRILRARGFRFRSMRKKPTLTKEGRIARMAFARKYKGESKAYWQKRVHMFLDNKMFQVFANEKGRAYAAQRTVRGAYRLPGQGLDEGYVVVPRAMRYNPGHKPALIAAAVGRGRVRLWHEVGGTWNAAAAESLYKGALQKACKKTWPGKRKFSLLEDNDPTGYESKKGIAAKASAGLVKFFIPKRSPDLNVMDYAVWTQVNRKMRQAEAKFPEGKKESRQQYLQRLRRTALSLPPSFVDAAIGDMPKRLHRLFKARGGHFEEGGLGST